VVQCVALCCSVVQCVDVAGCNTLQHTATHCNTLRHAVCCSVLQCVAMLQGATGAISASNNGVHNKVTSAVCCSVLQRVAVCCSVLQCAAVCCNVLVCVAVCHRHNQRLYPRRWHRSHASTMLQCVAVCCSVLQCVAVCCSVLQRVAACCSVPQARLALLSTALASKYCQFCYLEEHGSLLEKSLSLESNVRYVK